MGRAATPAWLATGGCCGGGSEAHPARLIWLGIRPMVLEISRSGLPHLLIAVSETAANLVTIASW